MRVRTRLIFLLLSLAILVVVGRSVTGGFEFVLSQFWFTSGFFLLLLLSLIDQPHFSKDANIFVNATTAWVSLLLVPQPLRSVVWWGFWGWATYLIVSSYLLMWARSRELRQETAFLQSASRINRQIGRPEALFSAFFLWGCILQFGAGSGALSALFLFWAIFMILNLPALSTLLDTVMSRPKEVNGLIAGVLERLISPRIAEVRLAFDAPADLVGREAQIRTPAGSSAASAVVIDDRYIAGSRIGRLGITAFHEAWRTVGEIASGSLTIEISETKAMQSSQPLSTVDAGSTIGSMVFYVHPDVKLVSGEVLGTQIDASTEAFFQVISAIVCQQPLADGNAMHAVKVTAGQLGKWDNSLCRFDPIPWVATAGQLVYRIKPSNEHAQKPPAGNESVGRIPNSYFPVHVAIEDVVTHNTAIIGVTGSGKSFLAFHLIEAMLTRRIKVLILDISRQHDVYLAHQKPTPLKAAADVKAWLESDSLIGIHQFAVDGEGYPKVTADFAKAAFDEVAKAKLERGRNISARLCVVFEEAHSLIPEWNQVAQQSDVQQVNRTARFILQGRKFGMGALIITQRTANVTKTILNQCNTIFALQSFDQTGLDFLRNYMGDDYSQAISTLPTRHAVLVGKASSSTRPLLMHVDDMAARWNENPA